MHYGNPGGNSDLSGLLASQAHKRYNKDMFGVSALSDIFIHYLFGQTKHQPLLLDFINAVLQDAGFEPLVSVQLGSPISPRKLAVARNLKAEGLKPETIAQAIDLPVSEIEKL